MDRQLCAPPGRRRPSVPFDVQRNTKMQRTVASILKQEHQDLQCCLPAESGSSHRGRGVLGALRLQGVPVCAQTHELPACV
eukprot:scaffold246609_cov17-Tisochrysis_lutea.AAC.1